MDIRLDKSFKSWGGFSTAKAGGQMIRGLLEYHPDTGIKLELVENPQGNLASLLQEGADPIDTIYGQLVNGTLVTLSKCFVTQSTVGAGISGPTTVRVNQAIYGEHIDDLDKLHLKKFSISLSSLSNWIGTTPVQSTFPKGEGFDITCRVPPPINVTLLDRGFDLQIGHDVQWNWSSGSLAVHWEGTAIISAHKSMTFETMRENIWQCQNLMSLMIGHRLSVHKVTMTPADAKADKLPEASLQQLYQQIENHAHPDIHHALMLLPYRLVQTDFANMVENWFARSKQATLASNVFFGSHSLESEVVNVKFLAAARAAEAYHRSLGTGFYMDARPYETAIKEFISHIPPAIQGDHRASLQNRLKYGNEHSLRKRLGALFDRLPDNVATGIATDVPRFIAKVVDTRNYFTHYDHASETNAFAHKACYIAAERLRMLVTANLLHDLGIKDDNLLAVLQRHQGFRHWMSQPLAL